jgi:hypothetical protein
VNSLTGTADTVGLVTQFHIQPVPEPSGVLLSAILSADLLGWARWARTGA